MAKPDRKKALAIVIRMSKEKESPQEDLKEGAEVEEEEHHLGPDIAEKIASDHLKHDPKYYEQEESGESCPICDMPIEQCECLDNRWKSMSEKRPSQEIMPLGGLIKSKPGNEYCAPKAMPKKIGRKPKLKFRG
jgi:hypothetical protein